RNPTPPDLRQQVFLKRGIVRLRDQERGRNSSLIRQHGGIDRVSRRVDRIGRFGQRQFPERLGALRRVQKPNPAKPSRKRRGVHLTQPSKPDPTLSSLNGVRNMSLFLKVISWRSKKRQSTETEKRSPQFRIRRSWISSS